LEFFEQKYVRKYWIKKKSSHYYVMVYIKNFLKICHCKKNQMHLQSFYCFKTLVTIFWNVFGFFSFIRLILNFYNIYTNTLKITLCENNSISNFLFFYKMLNTQNQTVVTITCVHDNVTTPIL
jgi:hypothetical protein